MEKKFEAYTLLEILVVLTIIGILMLVGMAGIPKLIDTANQKAVATEISSYEVAILNYKLDNDTVPSTVSSLLSGGYITQELADDPWGTQYALSFDSETRSITIKSAGPDEEFGTEDDILDSVSTAF